MTVLHKAIGKAAIQLLSPLFGQVTKVYFLMNVDTIGIQTLLNVPLSDQLTGPYINRHSRPSYSQTELTILSMWSKLLHYIHPMNSIEVFIV